MSHRILLKITMCGLLTFLAVSCAPLDKTAPDPEQDAREMNRLLELNDWNERAFAYHHYCLRNEEPINETFLKNLEDTADLLFDECLKVTDWEPDYIVSQIVSRRQSVQNSLREYYTSKGCQSEEAFKARDHYMAYSNSAGL